MGLKVLVRSWIHLRHERYKLVTSNHFNRLTRALQQDTQQRFQRLAERSVPILIESQTQKKIHGILIDRSSPIKAKSGERVRFIGPKRKQVASGWVVSSGKDVIKIKLSEPLDISLYSDSGEKLEEKSDKNYKLELLLTFDKRCILQRKQRIQSALTRFKRLSCSKTIHKNLLGYFNDCHNVRFTKVRVVGLKGMQELQGHQLLAVERSMQNRVSLIEGPAGSGKTRVAANIACSASRTKLDKILICSPVRSTVERISDMIHKSGQVRVVRLPVEDEERCESLLVERGADESGNNSCNLDDLVKAAIYDRARNRYSKSLGSKRYPQKPEVIRRQVCRMARNCSPWLKRKLERQVLRRADVVCCSTLQAGSAILRGIRFDMLIIDDAQVASELECMVPLMVKGLKQVTLLSDMRRDILMSRSKRSLAKEQLDLLVVDEEKANADPVSRRNVVKTGRNRQVRQDQTVLGKINKFRDLDRYAKEPGGLFERWLSIGLTTVALKHQYRMHESLIAFPNHHFYLTRIKTDHATNHRLANQVGLKLGFKGQVLDVKDGRFSWLPKRRCLTALFDTSSSNIDDPGQMCNYQWDIVRKIVTNLETEEKVDRSNIIVLSNSDANSADLIKRAPSDLEIGTIEKFVGQERDYVILTSFQSLNALEQTITKVDTELDCDYMQNENALNIALTRAKLGLFVVADCTHLKQMIEQVTSSAKQDMSPRVQNVKPCCYAWQILLNYYKSNDLIANLENLVVREGTQLTSLLD